MWSKKFVEVDESLKIRDSIQLASFVVRLHRRCFLVQSNKPAYHRNNQLDRSTYCSSTHNKFRFHRFARIYFRKSDEFINWNDFISKRSTKKTISWSIGSISVLELLSYLFLAFCWKRWIFRSIQTFSSCSSLSFINNRIIYTFDRWMWRWFSFICR